MARQNRRDDFSRYAGLRMQARGLGGLVRYLGVGFPLVRHSRLRGNDLAWLIAGGSRGASHLCLSTNLRGGPVRC